MTAVTGLGRDPSKNVFTAPESLMTRHAEGSRGTQDLRCTVIVVENPFANLVSD